MADHRHRDPSRQASDPALRRQWQREREHVLSEYGTWRVTADEDAPAAEEIRTLETLLRLKAEHQGSPEPGLWTEEIATALLTEVVPRTVVQPRERVMDMVPTLIRFVTYLRERGRWDPRSMSATAAPAMLGGLEFAALEAADDPTRRSFSTNILGHALALGVDLEDEDELGAFLLWYDALPDAERLALGETGRLEHPAAPFDRERALRTAREQGTGAAAEEPWLAAVPSSLAGAAEHELGPADYEREGVVRVALALLEVVGEGRRLTATGALGRAATAELLRACGIARGVRSMWDHPEVVAAWVALRDGGWLEVAGDRVRPVRGPVPVVTAAEDPEGFVELGHALLTSLLLGREARHPEDGGFRGMPDTAAALIAACGADGLPRREREEPGRRLRVRQDLDALVAAGALRLDGQRFRGSAALLLAAVPLLGERGAD